MSTQRASKRSQCRSEAQRRTGKGCAKSAVMQPQYRLQTETNKKKDAKTQRRDSKKALNQGLFSFLDLLFRY